MNKKLLLLIPILLLSASCSFGGKNIVSGAVNTVDGGADWQFQNAIQNSKATIAGLNVQKMAFDPNNRQEVYVGGDNGGLYRWDENSNAWKEILSNILIYDFAVSPEASSTIYAAGLFNDHGRLLVTKDGGATWTQIYNDASQDNPVRALAINPADTSQIVIGLGSGSIIKSADGGLSWQLAKDFSDRVNRMLWQGNNLYVLLQSKGLFVSSDFGQTFTQMTANINGQVVSQFGVNFSTQAITYNQFFVDTVSSDLIYVTTSNGLYKSVDGGTTWANIPLPITSGNSVTRAVAIAHNSSNVVYTSIGSTIYKTTDAGMTWQTQKVATNGTINYIIVDPQLPQIAWAGIYGAQ